MFEGSSNHPYRADAPTALFWDIGRSKLLEEHAVKAAHLRHVTLRTHGPN
nr:sugar nucleotide-binding protein [Methylocystis sp. B8]